MDSQPHWSILVNKRSGKILIFFLRMASEYLQSIHIKCSRHYSKRFSVCIFQNILSLISLYNRFSKGFIYITHYNAENANKVYIRKSKVVEGSLKNKTMGKKIIGALFYLKMLYIFNFTT